MPIVADFSVVTRSEFLVGRRFSGVFNTGGRHDSEALIDLAFLGGFRPGDTAMRVALTLNGRSLDTLAVSRWQDGSRFAYERHNIVLAPGLLRSGNNTLEIAPTYESASDYAFIGPVVVHFHQAA